MSSVFERLGVPMRLGERRFLHPGPLRWLRATVWMVVFFVLVAVASYGVEGVLGDHWPKSNGPAQFMANVAGALAALAAYPFLVWLAEGRAADELAPRAALSHW